MAISGSFYGAHKTRGFTVARREERAIIPSMNIPFLKMHGLGNDFVIVDARIDPEIKMYVTSGRVRQWADRQRGVGCDQFVLLENSSTADVFMRIFNPDGSEAGACGNATRCVADMILREKSAEKCEVETVSGILPCFRAETGQISVNMGRPRLNWQEIPLSEPCDALHLPLEGDPVAVSMGNPHCVFFCGNAEEEAVDKIGPKIERHSLFPNRTNVEFVSLLGPDHLRMRVWERGAGVTQACGTGACASAVAAIRRGLTGRTVRLTLDGGELLVSWPSDSDGVLMTGPVAYVFRGVLVGDNVAYA